LKVSIKSDTNSSSTEYAILETTTNKYVNYSNNTLSSSPVWGTRTDFGSTEGILVTGLNAGVQYGFKVKARNTQNAETSYSSTTSISTKLYTPTVMRVDLEYMMEMVLKYYNVLRAILQVV